MSIQTDKLKALSLKIVRGLSFRRGGALNRAYYWLASIKNSVYILALLALSCVIGTIFPQGGKIHDYINAGGAFQFLVLNFDLLDFFTSAFFLFLALLLLVSLTICTYERLKVLISKRRFPDKFQPTHTIKLPCGMRDAYQLTRDSFRKAGFKTVSNEGEWTVTEKGLLPYGWFTWIYHAAIITCFIGLILSYAFAYEDSISLRPHEPLKIAPETNGRLMGLFSRKAPPSTWRIALDEFSTEYNDSPKLDYPKEMLSRLAIGLGWRGVKYKPVDNDALSVRAWKSRVKVVSGGKTELIALIEVNQPLKYGGYTFYQEGYEQDIKIRVDRSALSLSAKPDEDFFIPGLDTPVRFSTFKAGLVHRLDGRIEKLRPFITVKRADASSGGKKNYPVIGTLTEADSLNVEGRNISLDDVLESSTLSYRYDPGVPVLWFAGICVLAAMAVRFYANWHTSAYNIIEDADGVILQINARAVGLFASADATVDRIKRHINEGV